MNAREPGGCWDCALSFEEKLRVELGLDEPCWSLAMPEDEAATLVLGCPVPEGLPADFSGEHLSHALLLCLVDALRQGVPVWVAADSVGASATTRRREAAERSRLHDLQVAHQLAAAFEEEGDAVGAEEMRAEAARLRSEETSQQAGDQPQAIPLVEAFVSAGFLEQILDVGIRSSGRECCAEGDQALGMGPVRLSCESVGDCWRLSLRLVLGLRDGAAEIGPIVLDVPRGVARVRLVRTHGAQPTARDSSPRGAPEA